MSDVQAFSVGRANNTPRDAVWKSDYDKLAAELAAQIEDCAVNYNQRVILTVRVDALQAALHKYGSHIAGCEWERIEDEDNQACDCGLREELEK